jgi:hypothetical protein
VTEKRVITFAATIYIAGDLAQAKQVCREFCMTGLCVTVEPVAYVYTGGEEGGVRVGLLNYPRFPADPAEITTKARALADLLRERLCQHSWLITTTAESIWNSTRECAPTPADDTAREGK